MMTRRRLSLSHKKTGGLNFCLVRFSIRRFLGKIWHFFFFYVLFSQKSRKRFRRKRRKIGGFRRCFSAGDTIFGVLHNPSSFFLPKKRKSSFLHKCKRLLMPRKRKKRPPKRSFFTGSACLPQMALEVAADADTLLRHEKGVGVDVVDDLL